MVYQFVTTAEVPSCATFDDDLSTISSSITRWGAVEERDTERRAQGVQLAMMPTTSLIHSLQTTQLCIIYIQIT